ncbi:histone acetyltransferase HAC1-like isoform X1 [Olea europaea subsp. europaea]|uniref:histone acetyltransferase n=1 Tax=Olea europaea subsp. europaea TaxID=158383 RepID=A0A8S0QKM0_OLEEU|nr:histone acetyltransferase HAC1-like isoform X1 [Olea europaea subsp. europaea]
MNLQTHLSGQMSGQVPNQAGTSLAGLPQHKGNPLHGHVQNPGIHRSVMKMDPEFLNARRCMTEKIYGFLMQSRQQTLDAPRRKLFDIVRRLEEGLFRSAMTKEEYLDRATLESRLQLLIKRMSNHNQQFSHANTSSSIGTMIPTPGLPQTGNSILTRASSVDSSVVANNGALSSGYQQSSTGFSISSGGNSMLTSSVQRMTSQMIPTPGFSNPNNEGNENANNQSFLNPEPSYNVSAFPADESTVGSQPMQHVGGQNSCMLQNIDGHVDRSTLQQTSYGLSNGSLNGGLGVIGNKIPPMNVPGTSEGYLMGTMHGNSPKPWHQHFDQHLQPVMQGDRYELGSSDASGSGNFHAPVTSVESTMNDQKFNAVSLQSMPNASLPLKDNQSNMHATQQVIRMKPYSTDESAKMHLQSNYSGRENLVQSHQPRQFQKPSYQFQHQQLGQQQSKQNQQSQSQSQSHQLLLKNDESQLPSDIGSKVKSERGTEHHDENLRSQSFGQFQFSDTQNQLPHNTMEDHSRSSQFLSHTSYSQDVCSSVAQTSEYMQQFSLPHQYAPNSQSDFSGFSGNVQLDSTERGRWHPKTHDGSQMAGKFLHDQNVPGEFRQRITGQDLAERNNQSSEESMIGQPDATKSAEPPNVSGTVRSSNLNREQQFKNQQKWLLFLRHARRCPSPEGKCQDPNCINGQKLLRHMEQCSVFRCLYPRCRATKALVNHHRHCRDTSCPVCVPVKNYVQLHLKAFGRADLVSPLPSSVNGSCKSHNTTEIIGKSTLKMGPDVAEDPEDLQHNVKRVKIEQTSQPLVSESERSAVPVPNINEPHSIKDAQHTEHLNPCVTMEPEIPKVEMEIPVSKQGSPRSVEMKSDNLDETHLQNSEGSTIKLENSVVLTVQEDLKIKKESDQGKHENTSLPSENASKSGKPNVKGVSLIELFTPEQVREHITGLRRWVGQSKSKAEKNQALEHSMSENSCQLCAVEKLTFEPPPLYCTPCGARIKRNAMYYTIGAGDTRHCFCIPCYNDARGDTIMADRTPIPKARLEKKKNDEETEEWWVQCDKCEAWQHQICALFNGRRNDGGQAEYTCPNCYVAEVERGERMPLPQSAVLGAKDLPTTILSDHIEQRLFRRLKQERLERARAQGRNYDEVPGAEALVVRVVSSVDKKLEVKPRFLEIFQEENYPSEFPYKSKVVLLFQKIEGVEVCLFGMYVQEFGSECQQPNHRRVYLSYLDSVKYFRPDVKTVTGEALRTFVYHEILIGYLEYCKLRGFTSCYIWACPPLKGEDYILYCHPEIQKTPKSDKLREWYLSMLRKAAKENVVVNLTNLYDHFFVSTGECKAKVTAARLPYFDGDYWPGAAEDMIYQLQQEEDGRKQHKGAMKRTITKRALKASGQTDLSGNVSRDILLMHKLGETISPMKEDFIMVHLQHSCSHCCTLMVSGDSWVCKQCKNFQLCNKCYESEQRREDRDRHPVNQKDKHVLYLVKINDVPVDTKDKDEILESEFFDTRQAFLSLCQGNHYQYDTLRRAKHSSMMVLYHLHNPTAPAFVMPCNVCQHDIEAGQGWHCETCTDYDVCNACYQKEGGINHPHKLTNQLSNERNAQNKEARQFRVQQLRKMLDLLVHASQCRSPNCQYPNCRKVKALFRHGMQCKVRASGGCALCKKMWYLLQLHSRACKESQCTVPRCRDLTEHIRRLQQQSESRRRAAVMEMMRQRTAEVSGNSG